MNFAEFFQQIHNLDPFPWQQEVADRLVNGEPLGALHLPTACGKTAVIDAAVYAASKGGRKRILFVIDRKVVVDEAFERATKIAAALNDTFLGEQLGLNDLRVIRLRGELQQDSAWVHYPEKTTVIISTVDQVGSRLLHRGYGVSTKMAPVHAGFLGNDALLAVDEAHLSAPFLSTLKVLQRHGADIRLLVLTATPEAQYDNALALSERDRAHPLLNRRLTAPKPVQLREVKGNNRNRVDALCEEAIRLSKASVISGAVVGVMVNRVATARAVFEKLKRVHEVVLLTGRIRPHDREVLVRGVMP